jgi:hypothetical protein
MKATWILLIGATAIVNAQNPQAEKPKAKLDELLGQLISSNPPDLEAARFEFSDAGVVLAPELGALINGHRPERLVIATDSSKTVAWVATDLIGMTGCIEGEPPENATGDTPLCGDSKITRVDGSPTIPTGSVRRATGLLEKTKTTWRPIVWHRAVPISGKDQAKASKHGEKPEVLPRKIAGAEAVVKQLETTMGDPKAFAASVSDRKDVVLYGSEPNERFVGGAAVKKQLAAWNLSLKLRDGVVAGMASTKSVAWVAANVNASNAKLKPIPYRLLAIYEQTGGAWKIVQLHFSYPNRLDDYH